MASARRVLGLATAVIVAAAACTTTGPTTTTAISVTTTSAPPAAAWGELAAMTVPRSEMAVAVSAGRIVVPGGYSRPGADIVVNDVVEIFDPVSATWADGPSLPLPLHHLMAAPDGADGVLVLGGFTDTGISGRVFRLVANAEAWAEVAPLPAPVGAGSAALLDGSVYVVGGQPGGNLLFRYDPAADTWAELAPMGQPREHVAAVAFAGEIWVLGGRWQGDGELASVEIYDPATGRWRLGPAMSEPRSGHAAATSDGFIVTLGGELVSSTRAVLRSVERTSGTAWEPLPDLPVGLHGVPAVAVGGVLHVLGGSTEAGAITNRGTVYALAVG
jgi:N-acetylneuraminic acid mutarotase